MRFKQETSCSTAPWQPSEDISCSTAPPTGPPWPPALPSPPPLLLPQLSWGAAPHSSPLLVTSAHPWPLDQTMVPSGHTTQAAAGRSKLLLPLLSFMAALLLTFVVVLLFKSSELKYLRPAPASLTTTDPGSCPPSSHQVVAQAVAPGTGHSQSPAGQGLQAVLPTSVAARPGGQGVQASLEVPLLNVPASHRAQNPPPTPDEFPAAATACQYWPGGQVPPPPLLPLLPAHALPPHGSMPPTLPETNAQVWRQPVASLVAEKLLLLSEERVMDT